MSIPPAETVEDFVASARRRRRGFLLAAAAASVALVVTALAWVGDDSPTHTTTPASPDDEETDAPVDDQPGQVDLPTEVVPSLDPGQEFWLPLPERAPGAKARVPTVLPTTMSIFDREPDTAQEWTYSEAITAAGSVASTIERDGVGVWIMADRPMAPFDVERLKELGSEVVEGSRATYVVTNASECDAVGRPATLVRYELDGVVYSVEIFPPADCQGITTAELVSWLDGFVVVRSADLPEAQLRIASSAPIEGQEALHLRERASQRAPGDRRLARRRFGLPPGQPSPRLSSVRHGVE